MNLLLYPHGGSGNHGCEAIVRSTLKITGANAILYSNAVEEDEKYQLNKLCTLKDAQQPISRKSVLYWKALFQNKVLGVKDAYDVVAFNPIFERSSWADFAFSIGGDNYCYGVPTFIYLINKELRKRNVKTILWGCSVEPDAIQGEMLEDLKGYTHIFARESLTYEAMKAKGIEQVSLFPDPAFLLERKDLPLPEGFQEGNTVGINVSPMVIGLEKEKGVTLQNYIELMKYIIKNTDMQIALIPHVVWSHNDDRIPLQLLYNQFKDTGRVCLIGDHSAEELKGYIARCRFMVVARTHASIAAYSEQVPTLVVGYSVKARGIAKDLFGTDENYVIPVQSFKQNRDLLDSFRWLMLQEYNIRSLYEGNMVAYCERTLQMRKVLNTL